MHFKRFEIQGYKSFATRTQFQIDPGITAVVGPNGSGKSNIMDALRWVLGGTASGLMRARRLEDVIFAGSESRAPAGLAEARIVLDNSAKWLPLDAPEVEVVRRVHRSGESEYRINDTSVRLRDIQELFARGGLGPGSQALMGQGLVEEVLRLRPEDRRGLIEEVAGVRGQRLRMIESRRKRAAAEENLARARLLVAEIAPRLRTVERQAGRAIQHAELSAELHDALRDFYGREWRRLGESRARRGADARDRAGDREAAESAAAQAEAAMEACRGEIEAARERLQAAAAERRRLDAALRDLESKQAITAERRDLLQTRLAELDGDIASLRERLDEPGGAERGGSSRRGPAERGARRSRQPGSGGGVARPRRRRTRSTPPRRDWRRCAAPTTRPPRRWPRSTAKRRPTTAAWRNRRSGWRASAPSCRSASARCARPARASRAPRRRPKRPRRRRPRRASPRRTHTTAARSWPATTTWPPPACATWRPTAAGGSAT